MQRTILIVTLLVLLSGCSQGPGYAGRERCGMPSDVQHVKPIDCALVGPSPQERIASLSEAAPPVQDYVNRSNLIIDQYQRGTLPSHEQVTEHLAGALPLLHSLGLAHLGYQKDEIDGAFVARAQRSLTLIDRQAGQFSFQLKRQEEQQAAAERRAEEAASMHAAGIATFSTSKEPNAPPATMLVQIPRGTLLQTVSGIQFATTAPVVFPQGARHIDVPVEAAHGGPSGNVAAGAIQQIISGLAYPLSVSNAAPTSGGMDAPCKPSCSARINKQQ